MSRRCRLPCPLPLIALMLLAVVGPLCGAAVAPAVAASDAELASNLIDVNGETGASTLPLDEATDEKTWTMVWSDLGVSDEVAPPAGAAGIEQFVRASARSSQAPPIIAAPLPPALLTGLIGLAGVYVYKRRHRLR